MSSIDIIRNSLISKLLTIKDQKLLSNLDELLSKSSENEIVDLTPEQMEMLKLSEDDVKYNRLLTQEELFSREREWLKEK